MSSVASRREQKQAARRERERRELGRRQQQARGRRRHRLAIAGVVAIAVTLMALAVALGGGDGGDGRQLSAHETSDHAGRADGPPAAGSPAPAFSALDVNSGRRLSAADLRGQRTLLFFSEGVGCQACMVQAAELERSGQLEARRIRLVSVTTDPASQLAEAARQYGIRTPLLSDESRQMMGSWGQLGYGGMGHPDTGGHSFVLVEANGKVVWERAYAQMYVPTDKLLDDMPA